LSKFIKRFLNDRASLILWAFFALGLVLRLSYLVSTYPFSLFPDEERFLKTANNILQHGEMVWDGRYAWDMPMMPVMTAFGISVFQENLFLFKIFLVALSSLTIIVTSRATYLVSKSECAMICCAAIMTFYPLFIFFSPLILTETLFLLLFSLSLLFVYRPKSTLYFGLVTGVAHLTRPTMLFFLPVVWIWQKLVNEDRLCAVALGALSFVLVINFWGLRNYGVFGEYLLTTASSGHVLLEGNNPWNDTGGPSGSFDHLGEYKKSIPEGVDELAIDKLKKSRAMEYIKDNPRASAILASKKLGRLWSPIPNSDDYSSAVLRVVSLLSTVPIFLLAGMSIWLLRPILMRISILYIFILYYSAIHMITVGSVRYRLPIDIVLIILASLSLACIWSKLKSRNS